jgi:histidine triad (HIT) family protein
MKEVLSAMKSDPSCVFCKIVSGQIPSARVYEDAVCFSFLDIGPLAEGHLLVIPKNHYERLHEMPANELAELASALPKLGKAILSATGKPAYNMLQNNGAESGQVVPHVHFHLIPRCKDDGLGYRWNAGTYPEGRIEQLAKAVGDALQI